MAHLLAYIETPQQDITRIVAIIKVNGVEKKTAKKSKSVRQAFDALCKAAKKLPEELKAELLTE